jgi:hypothetical protein
MLHFQLNIDSVLLNVKYLEMLEIGTSILGSLGRIVTLTGALTQSQVKSVVNAKGWGN